MNNKWPRRFISVTMSHALVYVNLNVYIVTWLHFGDPRASSSTAQTRVMTVLIGILLLSGLVIRGDFCNNNKTFEY